jgi:hypothetical protein
MVLIAPNLDRLNKKTGAKHVYEYLTVGPYARAAFIRNSHSETARLAIILTN